MDRIVFTYRSRRRPPDIPISI